MSLEDLQERDTRTDANYSQKAKYLLNLIKVKDKKLYFKLKVELQDLAQDETYNFTQKLLVHYKELESRSKKSPAKKKRVKGVREDSHRIRRGKRKSSH